MLSLSILDSFTENLIADMNDENISRQVSDAHYSFVETRKPSNPSIIHYSDEMIKEMGITEEKAEGDEFLHLVSGLSMHPQAKSYAMCYGGHQFGQWAGQLGDGRAINLFEVDHASKRWVLQLKGAGKTPYSRNADGLAVLRSSVREYLCSEAMHHLGVPTTRALSIALTGDMVLRDMLYDGHPEYEKGAIVCRVAPSFIRFGNFEIFAARQDIPNLKRLLDYTIQHHYSHIQSEGKDSYLQFFREVSEKTLDLMIHWQRVGFVHGVMNTDNMSILGLTIDFGPYGWMENYDPTWTPNTTDAEGRRYRFENQPDIGLWNLLQLANTLYPLIEDIPALEEILSEYHFQFPIKYNRMMADKLGILKVEVSTEKLIADLEKALTLIEVDMTIFFRNLSKLNMNSSTSEFLDQMEGAIYNQDEYKEEIKSQWIAWAEDYLQVLRVENQNPELRLQKMNLINPKYVLRNYMAQLAIDEADKGNYALIEELYQLLKKPYDEQPEHEKWFAKRPEWARTKVGCSMLSCSS